MLANRMTSKQFDEKILELQALIQDHTAVWPNDTKDKQMERKAKAAADPFYFAKEYFPHYIKKPFGKIHYDWHEYANKPDCITAIVGPHEHGKTVQFAVWIPIFKALHDLIKFAIFIGEDNNLSGERTTAIMLEFKFNKRIQHDFGEMLKLENPAGKDFTLKNSCRFLALGWKQAIRGKITRAQRPDYIVIDDLEDDKSHNRRIAGDKLDWVLGDVYGSIETGKTVVVWLANLTNKESAINYFKKECEEKPSPYKIFKLYRAILKDGSPLWPEGFTIKELQRKEDVIGYIRFQRHWQMNPVIEGLIFKSSWYKYFSLQNYIPQGTVITRVDPALGQKKSDYNAVITIEFFQAQYKIIDCMIRRIPVLDLIRYLYELDQRINTRIYMETNFWQVLLMDYVDLVADEYKYILPVCGVNTSTNKQEDILKLQPLFQRGKILIPTPKDNDVVLLEEMLGAFDPELSASNRIKDDGPDALARGILHFKYANQPREYRSAKKRLSTRFNRLN